MKTWECVRLFRKEVWYSDPVLPCSTRRSLFVGSEPNTKSISAMPSFVGSLCFFERNFQLPWNSMEFHGIRPHFLRKTTEITTEMDNVVIRELPAIVGILSPYRTPKSVLERRRRRSLRYSCIGTSRKERSNHLSQRSYASVVKLILIHHKERRGNRDRIVTSKTQDGGRSVEVREKACRTCTMVYPYLKNYLRIWLFVHYKLETMKRVPRKLQALLPRRSS